MTRTMLIVTACLLAVSLACGKTESTPAAKAPAAGAPGAVAANGAPATAAKAINANCPIGGDPIEAKGGTVTFKGHTIGFCCPKCAPEFNALDDAGKIAALAKNGTKLPE